MPGRLKFATASLPLGNLLKAVETYEGQNLHDPVATNVEDLLARIGYGKARGAGSYAADCAATGTDAAAGRVVVAMPLARGGAGAGAASSSSLAAFSLPSCSLLTAASAFLRLS